MADTYEKCEEYSSSTKGRRPLDDLADYQRLKKGSAPRNLFFSAIYSTSGREVITLPRKPKFRL
jgi:hypothetical protein